MPEPAPVLERRPAPVPAPAPVRPRGSAAAHARTLAPARSAVPDSMPRPVREAVAGASEGIPLPPAVGRVLTRGLGVDLSALRVHTGTRAATAAAHLGVRAFTWGRDVFLGHGEQPTDERLMAHEAAHAVQQSGGVVVQLFDGPHGHLEAEARSVAATVAGGEVAPVMGRTGQSTPRVQGLFGIDVKQKVLGFVRDKASVLPGYDLLGLALGRDPITQKPVERTPINFVKGVLGLVPGGLALFENLHKTGVIQRAFDWFSAEVTKLNLTWPHIRELFSQAWDALSFSDLLSPGSAWGKLKGIFGPPLSRIAAFARAAGRKVLEFIFAGALALAGSAGQQILAIFRRIGAVFSLIVDDPIKFLGNLLNAVKGGVGKFKDNILTHLRTGLFEWLIGSLEGVTLPKKWDFGGILSLILQILGLTYQALRGLLVKLIGEPAVAFVEKAFDFLVTVVSKGLGAAWEKIKEFASGLADTVVGAIRDWLVKSVVGSAITKLVTMFNPVGAIIQGIITIYNTVMFFIERAQQLSRMVSAILVSVENIARGNLSAAIAYVEKTMANTIPVILGFLARFIGLGNVTKYVRDIITKIRTTIANAVEKVGLWIKDKVKGLLAGKKATAADGRQVAADPARPGDALREPLTIAGAKHELRTVPGSYALQMASTTPVPMPKPGVEGLAEAYKAYLAAVNKATSPSSKYDIAKAEVKKLIKLLVDKSNPEHPAPGIGDVGPHGEQLSRHRDEGVPLWILRSEHVIPRFFVNALFELSGWAKVTKTEYNAMTTVMIYKGAEKYKDESTPDLPAGGDFALIGRLRTRVADREGLAVGAQAFKRAFRTLAHGAMRRTQKAVELDAAKNGKARGPVGKPEPPTPSADKIESTRRLQQSVIDAMTDARANAGGAAP